VPCSLRAEECFFGGGDGAIALRGAVTLELIESTLLPYRSTFLVNSWGFPQSMAAQLELDHVSLFGGSEPLFELQFARLAIQGSEVVFSHEPPTYGTLARVDADSWLGWRGRRNLYHGVRNYLVSRSGNQAALTARRLSDWVDSSPDIRDEESRETSTSPWLLSLSEAAAMDPNNLHVADAFRLARDPEDRNWRPAGARVVLPWGPLYPTGPLQLTSVGKGRAERGASLSGTGSPRPSERRPSSDVRAERTPPSEPTDTSPKPAGNDTGTTAAGPAGASAEGSAGRRPLDMKKVMSTTGAPDSPSNSSTTVAGSGSEPSGNAGTPSRDGILIVDPQSPSAFASLGAACSKAEDGAVIEIRYAGRLREPPIDLGDRHLTIRAAAGFRPIVEFVVDRLDLEGREPRLFTIRRGSLILRELDLVLNTDPLVSPENWSVVATRGADLTIDGCTVSVQSAPGLPTTLVRFLASDVEDPMNAPMGMETPRTQLQLRNSLVVGTSSLVRANAGMRIRFELENCAVEVQETLWLVSGGSDRIAPGSTHELDIRHSTIRTQQALIVCETGDMRPKLPRVEVTATDNLFVESGNVPWIQLRSYRPIEELRGLLRWKGVNNGYDALETVWEIKDLSAGMDGERYDWTNWLNSPARDEARAERGTLSFLRPPDDGPVWKRTRAHFKLAATRTGSSAPPDPAPRGVDITQLPAPPQERNAE
jgi:hypothetical protein